MQLVVSIIVNIYTAVSDNPTFRILLNAFEAFFRRLFVFQDTAFSSFFKHSLNLTYNGINFLLNKLFIFIVLDYIKIIVLMHNNPPK